MLTYEELKRIVSWQPYRDDWPVDRNKIDDNVKIYYGSLIENFKFNDVFDSTITEDEGMGTFLEILCHTQEEKFFNENCIMVCISLCSPYAAYGQIKFSKDENGMAWSWLDAETVGIIYDEKLKSIELEVIRILKNNNLIVIDNEYAKQELPDELSKNIDSLHEGNQIINALFQIMD